MNRCWRTLVAWWRSTEYDVVCVPLDKWHAMHDEISKAEAREWALGVQVEALKARLRLAEAVVEACRTVIIDSQDMRVEGHRAAVDALAAYDAVPGDS